MKGLTDEDLGRFRYAGYEAPVPAAEGPSSRQLFESAVRVLESPTGRLMKAVYHVVVELAERGDLAEMPVDRLRDDALRRLGYVAARAAKSTDVASEVSNVLTSFAAELYRSDFTDQTPLTVASTQSDSYLRVLRRRADGLSRSWQVYGDIFAAS